MQLFQFTSSFALVAFVVFIIGYTMRAGTPIAKAWILPAGLSAAFLAFSLLTLAQEGIVLLWTNHTQNFWGNQVWIDLLLAFAIGWTFLMPQARQLGMNVWVWMAALFATGCIGLLAMYARILYLKEQGEGAR